jgi:hypothetical protein
LPNMIEFSAYPEKELKAIFISKARKEGYDFDSEVAEAVMHQVRSAKNYLQDGFGNAGEIEMILGLMEDSMAMRIDPHVYSNLLAKKPEEIGQQDKALFEKLTVLDIPVFNKDTRQFVLEPRPDPALKVIKLRSATLKPESPV